MRLVVPLSFACCLSAANSFEATAENVSALLSRFLRSSCWTSRVTGRRLDVFISCLQRFTEMRPGLVLPEALKSSRLVIGRLRLSLSFLLPALLMSSSFPSEMRLCVLLLVKHVLTSASSATVACSLSQFFTSAILSCMMYCSGIAKGLSLEELSSVSTSFQVSFLLFLFFFEPTSSRFSSRASAIFCCISNPSCNSWLNLFASRPLRLSGIALSRSERAFASAIGWRLSESIFFQFVIFPAFFSCRSICWHTTSISRSFTYDWRARVIRLPPQTIFRPFASSSWTRGLAMSSGERRNESASLVHCSHLRMCVFSVAKTDFLSDLVSYLNTLLLSFMIRLIFSSLLPPAAAPAAPSPVAAALPSTQPRTCSQTTSISHSEKR
mmetsp:Transcript_5724/g.10535  ORF Transcript_5724/g.10535 Transcript_5724/m.10535 type:complete len:382 (+) Transcript_5724:3576-4721(+)